MNRQEQAKIERLTRGEKPGPYPFVRIEELRKDHSLIDPSRKSEDWDPRWSKGTVPELAIKYFTHKDGQYVDYGAWYGRFVRFMQQQGYRNMHAIDFVDLVDEADRAHASVHAVNLNTEAVPYPDNFFDGATAWGFPEHLENPHHFVREVHRTLKPGGIYICTFPNVEALATRLVMLKTGELRNYEAHNNHTVPYFPGLFAKTYLRYFDVVEKTYMRPHLSLPPYWLFKIISRYLPNNKFFGDHTVYVLKKKPFIPYA